MGNVVIFDFDGVLLDSFPDQFRWFEHICNTLGKSFPYSSLDTFRRDYREPVCPEMYSFLGFDWDNEKDIIWKEYTLHKENTPIDLFNGVNELVMELYGRGRTLAIASSNTNAAIYKQLKEHKLEKYFSVVVGKDDLPIEEGEPKLKPHPACLLLTLDKLGCSPREARYVGDQPTDVVAARKVAEHRTDPLSVVAVTYGFSPEDKLLEMNPDAIVHSPDELLTYLLSSRS